jgi:hypothetical protein
MTIELIRREIEIVLDCIDYAGAYDEDSENEFIQGALEVKRRLQTVIGEDEQ